MDIRAIKFTWNQILILYLVIVITLCNVLPIPEVVRGIMAIPAFLIIPYLFGHIILTIFKKYLNFSLSKFSYIFISFSVGFIFIPLIAFLLYTFHLFNITAYSFFVLLILLAYFIKSKKYDEITEYGKINMISMHCILFLFTFLVAVLYIYTYKPFPFIFNVDIPAHISITYLLKDYNYFYYGGNYYSILHVHLANISVLFKVDVYTLWWCKIVFLGPFLALLGFYILCLNIFRDKKVYILAFLPLLFTFTGLFFSILPRFFALIFFMFTILIIEKEFVPTYSKIKLKNLSILLPLFLFLSFLIFQFFSEFALTKLKLTTYTNIGAWMSILFFVIFILPIVLKKIFNMQSENFKILFLITIIMLLLYCSHFMMAMLIFPLVLLYIILRYLSEKNFKIVRILCILIVLFLLVIILLQDYGIHNFQVTYKQVPAYYFSQEFPDKMNFLKYNFWVYPLFLILLIGILFGIFDNKYKKIFPPLIIIIVGLFAFHLFVRAYGGDRALDFASPIVCMLIGYTLIRILPFYLHNKNKIKIVIIAVCVMILVANVIYNVQSALEKRISECQGNKGIVTIEEYKAGKWMQTHLSKETVIISDPRTMMNVGASSELRYVDMLTYPMLMRKRDTLVFNTLSLSDAHKIYTILSDPITWQRNVTMGLGVQGYPKNSFVIVITPTTVVWLNRGPMWYPSMDYSLLKNYINPFNPFLNTTYFTLLYNDSDKLYIFGVNPKPGVPFDRL